MTTLIVPRYEKTWPTLGDQVAQWIERFLVHGPGDLRGAPAKVDDEKEALLRRMYEIYPQGHPMEGRRRFKRCALSLRKGSAKTEFAAWIVAAELHPEAPVRCVGWKSRRKPIGGGVTDPYIPVVAYTEEQSEELGYGALLVILEHSELAGDFDLGLQRVMRIGGDGKAVHLATAPDSRDGARTTFQFFDETHRFILPRLKSAHRAMLANIPKRKLADSWSLETTTAPAPGEGSVAEDTMEYGRAVAEGRTEDAKLFFFHRQAKDTADLSTRKGRRRAVLEASGPVAEWSDVDGILDMFEDPTADQSYLRRVWLNQLVQSSDRAFDLVQWGKLAREYQPEDGVTITLGFDGSRFDDGTALVATEVLTGYQWLMGLWEKPFAAHGPGLEWQVPEHEVEARVTEAFSRYNVWRLYGDPPYWESTLATWAGRYGAEVVVAWATYRTRKMADTIRAFVSAMRQGDITHSGDESYTRHLGNAYRRETGLRTDEGEPLFVIQKERKDSPLKIDVAMAGILSWEARRDALTKGVGEAPRPSVYETRGALVL